MKQFARRSHHHYHEVDGKPMTLREALDEVQHLAVRVGEHQLLSCALLLVVRAAPLTRGMQHRLLTAGAALLEIAELAKRRMH